MPVIRNECASRVTVQNHTESNEDELDLGPVLRRFDREMFVQRILLIIGGLSLAALILAASVLHAAGSGPTARGRITGEPVGVPEAPGAPPEPSPLAPLSAPLAGAAAAGPPAAGPAAAAMVGSEVEVEIAGAALATPAAMPATPPPDVVDDSHPLTRSVFDRQDSVNRHPVDSDRPITRSTFDREDAVDEHPVP